MKVTLNRFDGFPSVEVEIAEENVRYETAYQKGVAALAAAAQSGNVLRYFDLRGVNFREMNIKGVRFYECDLSRASFYNADILDTQFEGGVYNSTSFYYARIKDSRFMNVMAFANDFESARIEATTFDYVRLAYCDWSSTELRKVKFSNADIHLGHWRSTAFIETTFDGVPISAPPIVVSVPFAEFNPMVFIGDVLRIGCQARSVSDWLAIAGNEDNALYGGEARMAKKWLPILAATVAEIDKQFPNLREEAAKNRNAAVAESQNVNAVANDDEDDDEDDDEGV